MTNPPKSRLEACLEEFAALSNRNHGVLPAGEVIAIVTRIMGAEPSAEEIEKAAKAIHFEAFGFSDGCNNSDIKYAKAALMTMFGEKRSDA